MGKLIPTLHHALTGSGYHLLLDDDDLKAMEEGDEDNYRPYSIVIEKTSNETLRTDDGTSF